MSSRRFTYSACVAGAPSTKLRASPLGWIVRRKTMRPPSAVAKVSSTAAEHRTSSGLSDSLRCTSSWSRPLRRCLVLTPRTKLMASTRFDLPAPFGPTTQVNFLKGPTATRPS